jgi:hypothetical protein
MSLTASPSSVSLNPDIKPDKNIIEFQIGRLTCYITPPLRKDVKLNLYEKDGEIIMGDPLFVCMIQPKKGDF